MKQIRILITSMLFLLVAVIGIIVIASGRKEFSGFRTYSVVSGSMEPTIRTGSLILVQKKNQYANGDIAAYISPTNVQKIITHRIVETTKNDTGAAYVFKGDANKTRDVDLVTENLILGKYLFGIPFLGYIVEYAKTPMGVVLLIIIPGTIILLEELTNIKSVIQSWRKKE